MLPASCCLCSCFLQLALQTPNHTQADSSSSRVSCRDAQLVKADGSKPQDESENQVGCCWNTCCEADLGWRHTPQERGAQMMLRLKRQQRTCTHTNKTAHIFDSRWMMTALFSNLEWFQHWYPSWGIYGQNSWVKLDVSDPAGPHVMRLEGQTLWNCHFSGLTVLWNSLSTIVSLKQKGSSHFIMINYLYWTMNS